MLQVIDIQGTRARYVGLETGVVSWDGLELGLAVHLDGVSGVDDDHLRAVEVPSKP